jgi:predicted TPR repeat methyltransferase
LDAEPRDADALHLLGVIAGRTGRNEAAVELLRQAVASRPGHAETRRHLGVALNVVGRMEEAVAECRQAIALDPGDAEACKNLGSALYHLGQLDAAIAAFRQAIVLRPDYPEALGSLGAAFRENGQPGEAIAACTRAISLRPDYPEARNSLGNALLDTGCFDEAIATYRNALQFRPRFAPACNNLGIALNSAGRPEEAIAAFRDALRIQPGHADALNNLGTVLRDQGHFDEAAAAFRAALASRPDFADAFANLGGTLRDQGRFDEAIAAYLNALRIRPDSSDWWHVLAALTGESTPVSTPPGYVRNLFDPYATQFDDHLVRRLHYCVPEQFLDAVLPLAPGRCFDILDLGCGTGLCGVPFRPFAKSLTGVDLSPAMLAKATERGIYDRLITADIGEALRGQGEETCDLILAGDTFIYVGNLGGVFPAAFRVLRPGGLFAFSVEQHDGPGFALHRKVRFAHSLGYIRDLTFVHRFTELHIRDVTLRKSGTEDVSGWIFVLQKPVFRAGSP